MLNFEIVYWQQFPAKKIERVWRNFFVPINPTIYQYCVLRIGILNI